jgi:hypothetical protein
MEPLAAEGGARPLGRSHTARIASSTLALDVSVVASVALVLGLIRLGTPSFWVDEAFTAWRTEQSYGELVEGYHWLYQTIVNVWATFAGTSEWSLRFPSVVGAMLACALLVVLARMVFDDRRIALLSGLLLATSPFLVKWSQQARGYTLLVALSVLASILLLHALDRGSRAAWAVYGLAFAAVVVWHPIAGAVLVPAHLVLAAQRRDRVLPHGLLAALIVLALGGMWAGQIIERSTGEGPGGVDWLNAPSPASAVGTFLGVSGAAGVGAILALAGGIVLWRTNRARVASWLGLWAIAPFALTLAVLPLKPLYLDRYLITAAPAFALLGGAALGSIRIGLRMVAIAAVVLATVLGLARWYSAAEPEGNWRGENWRDAVHTVLERRSVDEPILVVPWSVRQAAMYYGVEQPVATSTAPSVWVVTWSEEARELTPEERSLVEAGGRRLVERQEFGRRVTIQQWRTEE